MGWIALYDTDTSAFDLDGLGPRSEAGSEDGSRDDELVTRGTLVIESRVPNATKPRTLIRYERGGEWPFYVSLQVIPGGTLIFVLNQGGSVQHQVLNPSEAGRIDVLRLSVCWDSLARRGHLALERNDQQKVLLVPLSEPCPIQVRDLRALFQSGENRFIAPDVSLLALSDQIEPVGPMPSLCPDTPIATPGGYQPLRTLRRGDTVLTANGDIVPVLHKVTRVLPARGTTAPLYIRAPYFGLQKDIRVAPSQRLVLSGSEVEYLFGQEFVLAPAGALTGGHSVKPAHLGLTVTYSQLLLPTPEPILAGGTLVESLFIGRLHRKPHHLAASALAGLERSVLPDHGKARFTVLRPFDARILAERRVA